MRAITLVGTYEDAAGCEDVVWTIAPSTRPGWNRRYEVSGVVRGVPVTEEVPEFYVCEQFEPRLPGTGYRG